MRKEIANKIMNIITKSATKSAMQSKGPIGAKPMPMGLKGEK